MPLSTTHAMGGALFGIALACKLTSIKDIYKELESQEIEMKESKLKDTLKADANPQSPNESESQSPAESNSQV